MKKKPVYMIYESALGEMGMSWQVTTFWVYLWNRITGKYKVRIDWYTEWRD